MKQVTDATEIGKKLKVAKKLLPFTRHKSMCGVYWADTCSCGLDKIRKKLKKRK